MKLRDSLWMFGVPPHENDTYVGGWLRHRTPGDPNRFPSTGSSMTPAEAAFFLGIPNMIMVCCDGMPSPFTEYADKYLYSFTPLKRVLWSSTGSGGYRNGREEEYVVARHEKYPNLCGCYMDDPLPKFSQFPEEERTKLAKEFVSGIRDKLNACSRPMDILVTWYPQLAGKDDAEIYKDVSGIAVYTSNAVNLIQLDKVIESAKSTFPDKKIYLGCYLYDYPRSATRTPDQMEFQCERGKKWLLDGTIAGMIFVTNAVMAPGMTTDLWLRDWIQKNGDLEIPEQN